jgi:uncharacterized protein YjbI with pentapeptide repeats
MIEIKNLIGEVIKTVAAVNLYSTNLSYANLYGADLRGADLSGANLRSADLRGADLYGTNLSGADLSGANLYGANLYSADLSGADLSGANLSVANLSRADLSGANTDNKTTWPHFKICPEIGSFLAWKKTTMGVIKIRIPKDAKRTSSLVGRKCRAEFVKVIGGPGVGGSSPTHGNLTYNKGEIVRADKFDDDIRVECTSGIHFYMTRKEAEEHP